MSRRPQLLGIQEGPGGRSLTIAARRPAGDAAEASAMLGSLQDALDDADDKAIVLVGSGDGFFVAEVGREPGVHGLLSETCMRLVRHRLPVLAAIHAPALDAGLELALACDLRFAARGIEFGFPRAREGALPVGSVQRLIHEAGVGLATRLLLLGDIVQAGFDPALETLVEVVEDPSAATAAATARLAEAAPIALEALKTATAAAAEMPPHAGFAIEADLAALLLPTADRAEGINAFRERRPPEFHGR